MLKNKSDLVSIPPDLSRLPITHKRGCENARLQFHLLLDWLRQRSLCWPAKVYYQPSRLSSICCGSYDIWPLQTRLYNFSTMRWAALAVCTAARDIQALSHHLQSHQRHCAQLYCCYVRAFVNEPGSSTPTFFGLSSATSPADQNWARKTGLRVMGNLGHGMICWSPCEHQQPSPGSSRPFKHIFFVVVIRLAEHN